MKKLIMFMLTLTVLALPSTNAEPTPNPKQKVCDQLNKYVSDLKYDASYVTYSNDTLVLHIHSKDMNKLRPSFVKLNMDNYVHLKAVQSVTTLIIKETLMGTPEAIKEFKKANLTTIKVKLLDSEGNIYGSNSFNITD